MTFVQVLTQHLQRNPSKPYVYEMHAEGAKAFTGSSLLTMASAGRAHLREAGLTAGSRVGLLAPNSASWVAADLAMLQEGLIVVPLYARQAMHELIGIMGDCDVQLLVVADEVDVSEVQEAYPELAVVRLSAFTAHPEPAHAPVHAWAPGDVATLIYTSGTSGTPKGVQTTVAGVDHMLPVTSAALADLMGSPGGNDRVFHYLPLCFAGSRIVLWTCLYRDNPIHLSMDLDRLLDEIGAAKPSYFLNVPVLLERVKNGAEAALAAKGPVILGLYQRAREAFSQQLAGRAGLRDRAVFALASRLLFAPIRAKLGPNLRFLICGSAPLSEDTQRWFEMIGVPVYQVYGLTETTAIVTMDRNGEVVPGRTGFPIEGCEVEVTEEGELLVRGPHVFSGYWNRPEATADALQDGWFHTGDQVVFHDGNLQVIGRVKNILVPSSGHNVPPEPIEQSLREAIFGVEQAVVIGHGKPFLTALFTGDVSPQSIQSGIDTVNETLPHYRRIRAFHHRTEPLTDAEGLLTANGKLKRKAINAHFATAIEEMYP